MGRMRGMGERRLHTAYPRFGTLLILMTALAMLAIGGCQSGSGGSEFGIVMEVRSAQGDPVLDAQVTPWIVDVDRPADIRQPEALEAQFTDENGLVRWTFESAERPYVCGYEIRDVSGAAVLESIEPQLGRTMSTLDGFVSVELP